MLRRFTKDVGKNFRTGQSRDLPKATWDKITTDAGFRSADDYSEALDPVVLGSPHRGKVGRPQRLGTKAA